LTGGEPLLRDDFFEIYMMLKRKGLLLSVFTNATLITQKHIDLFKKYPPRDIEVSVYGVTKKTYEAVTKKPGTFNAFMRGLSLLMNNQIPVTLKAMAIRSNSHEIKEMLRFCRKRSKTPVRFDPFLHLRYDRNAKRNEKIKTERLTPEEIIHLEKSDSERYDSLQKGCEKLIVHTEHGESCRHIFHCGVGGQSFVVGWDGYYRLCQSLHHPDCIYDLRKGSLKEAWDTFVPKVWDKKTQRKEFLERCHRCSLFNLCTWCPAHAHLETGELDLPVEYFCEAAHLRKEMLDPT
jgi:radical SAM protein with 4Fe4S-binding SPASM domain